MHVRIANMSPTPFRLPAHESITTAEGTQWSVLPCLEKSSVRAPPLRSYRYHGKVADFTCQKARSSRTEGGVDPCAMQLRIARGSGRITILGDPVTRCGGQERRPRLIRSEALGPAHTKLGTGIPVPLLHLHASLPARYVQPPRQSFGEAHSWS